MGLSSLLDEAKGAAPATSGGNLNTLLKTVGSYTPPSPPNFDAPNYSQLNGIGKTQTSTQAIADESTPNVTPLSVAKIPIDLVKSIFQQETKPSDTQLDYEKQNYPGSNLNPRNFVGKVITRFINPALQPFADNISQLIQANDPKTYNLKPADVMGLPIFQKSNTQIVGDTAQAVLTAYAPSIFGKEAAKLADTGVANSFLEGAKHGATTGLMFGASQAASSGSTDPNEIASIIGKSILGLSILGGITSSAIPVSKATLDRFKTDVVKETGLTPEQIDTVVTEVQKNKESAQNTPALESLAQSSMISKDGVQKPLVETQIAPETAKPSVIGRSTTQTLKPIEGTGITKARGLSEGVEAKAIENKLSAGFGDLPEYQTVSMADQAQKASDFISKDYDTARSIALGEKAPPKGILPESIFVAVEDKAIKEGDVRMLQDLANSKLSASATTMGQRIRTLGERDPTSPVGAIQEVQNARIESLKGKDITRETQDTVKQIKDSISKVKTTKETWNSFLESITC